MLSFPWRRDRTVVDVYSVHSRTALHYRYRHVVCWLPVVHSRTGTNGQRSTSWQPHAPQDIVVARALQQYLHMSAFPNNPETYALQHTTPPWWTA